MSNDNVLLQNLRDFTVQIRRASDDAIVGTGIAVHSDGQVVTCAHVAEEALGVHPREAGDAELGVYFPQARQGEKARRATVAACFPQHDDDVVLLQLTVGPAPLGPHQVAILGTAEASSGNPFRSYGYRPMGTYEAAWADGSILGIIDTPGGLRLQANPVQLQSQHIAVGMSGAAVLDVERNLVVGLISERWVPGSSFEDRDTGWAVNARVLTFEPMNLPVRDEPLAKRPAPQPKTDVVAARAAVAPTKRIEWNNAPAALPEWVGRAELLRAISSDWADPERHVSGLIGFGGEGKSSLARRWVDDLLASPSQTQPNGLFWWGFYTQPSVDEFFEAALDYMSGGAIAPRKVPSASVRAQVIGAMLGAGRYLFVLDGLEVMQHPEGDRYGLLKSADLRDLLHYFAAPGHESFCVVISRAPLLDLVDYTTFSSYTERKVRGLGVSEARLLMRNLGVKGKDKALDSVVADWDGHALALSLLAALLVEEYDGNVAKMDEITMSAGNKPRYERVHHVLRSYDKRQNPSERAFLMLFSAFRTPVHESAFDNVFRAPVEQKLSFLERLGLRKRRAKRASPLRAPIVALDETAFQALVQRLRRYRILRYDPGSGEYTAHPLVRAHYLARLTAGDRAQLQETHQRIKDYYLELAGDTPRNPTLDDLAPLIEVVHHLCQAGAYDEAGRIYLERIHQSQRGVLTQQLGAYETDLAMLHDFFPAGDTSQDPQVSDPRAKGWILGELGLCLMSLGRLGDAVSFYERLNEIRLSIEDWHNASRGYQNLADLHAQLGALAANAEAAGKALALAHRAENKEDECTSLTSRAWAAHLRGELQTAGAAFQQAESLEQEINPTVRYLYSGRGIPHADHLRRTGEAEYARRVSEANLEMCKQQRWAFQVSQCHRVLGDLDADAGQHQDAGQHYHQALKIARSVTRRDVLIEALLARGRWAARHLRDAAAASGDLNEALGYAVDGGYRIYEADIRIALAWAHLAAGEPTAARAEAQRALQMSLEMGYYWGQVDAAEALATDGLRQIG